MFYPQMLGWLLTFGGVEGTPRRAEGVLCQGRVQARTTEVITESPTVAGP